MQFFFNAVVILDFYYHLRNSKNIYAAAIRLVFGVLIMNNKRIKHFLDITDQICPMTFVRTKLLIEKLSSGEQVTVRLQGAEPLQNVPRTVREHGHQIISLGPEDASNPDGPHLLVLEKA
jgi:TusA-related sulfurtransferase